MMELNDLKLVGAGITLALLVPMAASAADPEEITIWLSYSEAALEQLDRSSEEVIVSATYSATPAPGSMIETNEIGLISLGSNEVQVLPSQNEVSLPVDGLVLPDLAEIKGPITVNINVFSARLGSDDNILNCDLFEGPLESLREAVTELHCSLITDQRE